MLNEEVTIVIVSHKSKKLIVNLIKKINKYKIIVIDNSNDFLLKKALKNKHPKINVHIVKNNGYGDAINYASKFVKSKYMLVCNPDIKNITNKKINIFLKIARMMHDNFSVLGPRYIKLNNKSIQQSDNKKRIVEWKYISGACMFIKKKNFDIVKGFDNKFFLYFEESDFCKRIFKINKNYQINEIKIYHKPGKSTINKYKFEDQKLKKLLNWHFIWSKFYFYKKHYTFLLSILIFFPILTRSTIKFIINYLKKDEEKKIKYLTRLNGLWSSMIGLKSYKRINNI